MHNFGVTSLGHAETARDIVPNFTNGQSPPSVFTCDIVSAGGLTADF